MLRKFSESYKNREIFSQRFQRFRRFRWFDLIWRFFQNKLWALKILNSTRKPNRSKLSQVANSLKRMNEVLSLGSDRNECQLKGWKLENWNKVTKNGIYKWRSKIKDRKFTEISCVWVLLQSREPVDRRLTPDFAGPKKWKFVLTGRLFWEAVNMHFFESCLKSHLDCFDQTWKMSYKAWASPMKIFCGC